MQLVKYYNYSRIINDIFIITLFITSIIIGTKTIINDLPNKDAGINFLYIIFRYKLIYNPFPL